MIGILSAMTFEKEGIMEAMQLTETREICKIEFAVGQIGTTAVVVAACGEGKVNAARGAQLMIDHFHVSAILNIGVAGGMHPVVKKRDLIVADRVVQYDLDMTATGVPLGLVPRGPRSEAEPWGTEAKIGFDCSGRLVSAIRSTLDRMKLSYHVGLIGTGDLFVADSQKKNEILAAFEVLACEMEGAAIGCVCDCAGVEFAEIRDISDNADDDAEDSYYSYREHYGLPRIICEILAGIDG